MGEDAVLIGVPPHILSSVSSTISRGVLVIGLIQQQIPNAYRVPGASPVLGRC